MKYSEHILNLYLLSNLIKRQLSLSHYNEIEIDLFTVFPSPTQQFPGNVNKMSISMNLYPLILESTDLQQAAEINSTRNVNASDGHSVADFDTRSAFNRW
jgi:hypothetical protein